MILSFQEIISVFYVFEHCVVCDICIMVLNGLIDL